MTTHFNLLRHRRLRVRDLALPALALGSLCAAPPPAAAVIPHHDHVVVVIMENKSYDEARTQPYTTSLMSQGAVLAQSYALVHPSQPNYTALWAGSTLGVTSDFCPAPGSPFRNRS